MAQQDWQVSSHDEFAAEVRQLSQAVREKLKAAAVILSEDGPLLGRPLADTLKGSRHANMKELRFDADGGAWRVAYAFDPERKAILLAGGDKSGTGKVRFYRNLLRVADERFDQHLRNLRLKR
ncbi:MAG: type II toxin-antitoxin system RelE/ParE family toxin [Terracidiphilus sp.]